MEYLVIYGLAALLMIIGISSMRSGRRGKNLCTLPVTAIIADVRCTQNHDRDENGLITRERYSYTPLYEYTVGGRLYRANGHASTSDARRYIRGMQEQIRCNPQNPAEISSAEMEKTGHGVGTTFIFAGLVIAVLTLLSQLEII